MRVAQKPFTFSDGTYLPSGTFVAVPSKAMYRDPSLYPDGERFDGFRFDRKDEAHTMSHLASTSSDWLHFGHGKHAW
jgi:cytochrome P450